jgi:hypothetical protein
MTMIAQLGAAIERRLMLIEELLPLDYRLTLLARHTTIDDADILLTVDDIDLVIAALERLKRSGRVYDPKR